MKFSLQKLGRGVIFISKIKIRMGPPWNKLACPVHPMDARLDFDLGSLESGAVALASLPAVPCACLAVVHWVFSYFSIKAGLTIFF